MKETRCVIFEGLYAVTAGADTLPLLVDSEIRPDGSNLKTAINCKVESCRRWNDFRERERERTGFCGDRVRRKTLSQRRGGTGRASVVAVVVRGAPLINGAPTRR